MRRVRAGVAAVGVAMLLAGCAPGPSPSPSPTGFADEDAAFAAAEATYRAYVDALNRRRASPTSTPDPIEFLSGSALSSAISADQKLKELQTTISGATHITSVKHLDDTVDVSSTTLQLAVCLDSSGTTVRDARGSDVTPVDRATKSPIVATMIHADSVWVISESSAGDFECS